GRVAQGNQFARVNAVGTNDLALSCIPCGLLRFDRLIHVKPVDAARLSGGDRDSRKITRSVSFVCQSIALERSSNVTDDLNEVRMVRIDQPQPHRVRLPAPSDRSPRRLNRPPRQNYDDYCNRYCDCGDCEGYVSHRSFLLTVNSTHLPRLTC